MPLKVFLCGLKMQCGKSHLLQSEVLIMQKKPFIFSFLSVFALLVFIHLFIIALFFFNHLLPPELGPSSSAPTASIVLCTERGSCNSGATKEIERKTWMFTLVKAYMPESQVNLGGSVSKNVRKATTSHFYRGRRDDCRDSIRAVEWLQPTAKAAKEVPGKYVMYYRVYIEIWLTATFQRWQSSLPAGSCSACYCKRGQKWRHSKWAAQYTSVP